MTDPINFGALLAHASSRAPSSAREPRPFIYRSSFDGDSEPAWFTRYRQDIAERKRQRPTIKRSKATIPDLHVELQPLVRPALDVRLSYGTIETIERELRWIAPTGAETGGHLFSNDVPLQRGPVIVTMASEPPAGSWHSRGQIRMRPVSHVQRELPSFLSHLVPCGNWHSHPNGNGKPSQTDCDTWADILRSSRGLPYYLSVICTPDQKNGMGWMDPRYSAWVTYQEAGTKFVTEPARIV